MQTVLHQMEPDEALSAYLAHRDTHCHPGNCLLCQAAWEPHIKPGEGIVS